MQLLPVRVNCTLPLFEYGSHYTKEIDYKF